MIEIKDRRTGSVLLTVNADTLVGANLTGADLTGADLTGANLTGADLTGADLTGATIPTLDNGDFISDDTIEDGGPAFPLATVDGYAANGMRLRDYFAGKALQGLLAANPSGPDKLAQFAYEYADAMLRARGYT